MPLWARSYAPAAEPALERGPALLHEQRAVARKRDGGEVCVCALAVAHVKILGLELAAAGTPWSRAATRASPLEAFPQLAHQHIAPPAGNGTDAVVFMREEDEE
eukprot:3639141-Prymnesium_polylepis.1